MPRRKKTPLSTEIPEHAIRMIVGNYHVGTPHEEIEQNIRRRCKKAGASPELEDRCARFAREVHDKNRELYRAVMSGRF